MNEDEGCTNPSNLLVVRNDHDQVDISSKMDTTGNFTINFMT